MVVGELRNFAPLPTASGAARFVMANLPGGDYRHRPARFVSTSGYESISHICEANGYDRLRCEMRFTAMCAPRRVRRVAQGPAYSYGSSIYYIWYLAIPTPMLGVDERVSGLEMAPRRFFGLPPWGHASRWASF